MNKRRLVLIIVAYHPCSEEVDQLQVCLEQLDPMIGYAIVVNDYQAGEPIERLSENADCFIRLSTNPGYGAAVNHAVRQLQTTSPYIAALNTDLSWSADTFESIVQWMDKHQEVCLATPTLLDQNQEIQMLCKRNPTVLALLSRRFWPQVLKPRWLRRYDRWFVMADQDYASVFPSTYLSGCCMVMRSSQFLRVGGFDERFFLYLEDADLTRSLSAHGLCVHLPFAKVVHHWGRGSYRSLSLALVNMQSAWIYFRKWGLAWY